MLDNHSLVKTAAFDVLEDHFFPDACKVFLPIQAMKLTFIDFLDEDPATILSMFSPCIFVRFAVF